jgi:hypothetical protein
VLAHAIAGHRIMIEGEVAQPGRDAGLVPGGVPEGGDARRRFYSIDYLLGHLDDWERDTARPSTAFAPPRGGASALRRRDRGKSAESQGSACPLRGRFLPF